MQLWACVLLGVHLLQAVGAYWMDEVAHQGLAPFNLNPNYPVFRNVKTYGAKGDGMTDDTAAINAAISDGNRCGFGGVCQGATTTPAIVYFPAGFVLPRHNASHCGSPLLIQPQNLQSLVFYSANLLHSTGRRSHLHAHH